MARGHTLSYTYRRKFRQGTIDAAFAQARARATGFEPDLYRVNQKYPRLPPLTSYSGGTTGRRSVCTPGEVTAGTRHPELLIWFSGRTLQVSFGRVKSPIPRRGKRLAVTIRCLN